MKIYSKWCCGCVCGAHSTVLHSHPVAPKQSSLFDKDLYSGTAYKCEKCSSTISSVSQATLAPKL